MATAPKSRPTPPVVAREKREIRIVSHSNLFYWWPLWLTGFILAFLTYMDRSFLTVVPEGTKALRGVTVVGEETYPNRDVLVLPEHGRLSPKGPDQHPEPPYMRVAEKKSYGVFFTIVLLILIVITNVPLRGLWSVLAIGIILFVSLLFAYLGVWESVMDAFMRLHIFINFAGYLLISGSLLMVWLLVFFLFDSQIYMVFTPGQLRVRQEIGGGEVAYDTAGMSIQKQRNDLFRHGLLGLGSGDLIVHTSGAATHHFELPNVLFIGHKVKMIEDMLREKAVVPGTER